MHTFNGFIGRFTIQQDSRVKCTVVRTDLYSCTGTVFFYNGYSTFLRKSILTDDFLLKSEFSLSFMRTQKNDLSAKQEQDGQLFLPYDSGICGC